MMLDLVIKCFRAIVECAVLNMIKAAFNLPRRPAKKNLTKEKTKRSHLYMKGDNETG
ncbi:MAG: hypothetical protein KJ773_03400 [Candidatus Thermoplasmatota archaeon]|nr:hypothetical protein [Candidatus Thermoplasmatota archaeon]